MKQFLTAFVVFSIAAAFSGCSESQPKSSSMSKNDSAQSASASSDDSDTSKPSGITYGDKFPEVLKVAATSSDDNKWRFNVTLSSTYDSPDRYADAWRVLDDAGQELGIRVLGHDHAGEQPFTRSETIEIPSDVKVVFVEGRDQANGWSGQRFEFRMPSR